MSSDASAPELLVDSDDTVLSLRFSNPSRANALTPSMLDALVNALERRAPKARVVLLGGAGERHFSAGLDLSEATPEDLSQTVLDGERLLGRAAGAIEDCPRPVVAVVNGSAFGGALELAMACDWRVASPEAKLGMPAARIGVVYAADGLRRFVRELGPSRTRRLFLTGRPLSGREALEIGLVDQLAADGDAWEAAGAAGADVAGAAPLAVAGTRATVRALTEGSREEGPLVAERWRARAFGSEDFREGLAAFRDKRTPDFKER